MPASKTAEPRTGRIALVTGAAQGIGQAIAAGLADRRTASFSAAAFNRRETQAVLLNARAGAPSWGPELLARTTTRWEPGSTLERWRICISGAVQQKSWRPGHGCCHSPTIEPMWSWRAHTWL